MKDATPHHASAGARPGPRRSSQPAARSTATSLQPGLPQSQTLYCPFSLPRYASLRPRIYVCWLGSITASGTDFAFPMPLFPLQGWRTVKMLPCILRDSLESSCKMVLASLDSKARFFSCNPWQCLGERDRSKRGTLSSGRHTADEMSLLVEEAVNGIAGRAGPALLWRHQFP